MGVADLGRRPKMKSERMNAPDNQVSREAAKSAKAAGLLRVFAASREPRPQFRQRDTVVVHGKVAHFVTAVIDHSQPPNQSLQRNAHCRGLRRRQDFVFMVELIINRQPSGRG